MSRLVRDARFLVESTVNATLPLRWLTLLRVLLVANFVFIGFDVEPAEAWGLRVSRPPPAHTRLEPPVRRTPRLEIEEPFTSRVDRFPRDNPVIPTTPHNFMGPRRALPPLSPGEARPDPTVAASPAYRAGQLAVLRFRAIAEGADPAAPGFEKMLEDQLNLVAPIPGSLAWVRLTLGTELPPPSKAQPAAPIFTLKALEGTIEINRAVRVGPIEVKPGKVAFAKVELATVASIFATLAGWFTRELASILSAWSLW